VLRWPESGVHVRGNELGHLVAQSKQLDCFAILLHWPHTQTHRRAPLTAKSIQPSLFDGNKTFLTIWHSYLLYKSTLDYCQTFMKCRFKISSGPKKYELFVKLKYLFKIKIYLTL